jgi:hypothetical protein
VSFAYRKRSVGQYGKRAFIMHKLHLKATGRFCLCLKMQQKELNAFSSASLSCVVNRFLVGMMNVWSDVLCAEAEMRESSKGL